MEIDITGSLVTITRDDGTTQILNGANIVDDSDHVGVAYNTGVPTQPTGSDPYNGGVLAQTTHYRIYIHLVDQREEDFWLYQVTNQPGWTDDLAGANNAVADISAAMVAAGGGGSGTVTSVGVSGANGIGVTGSPVTTSGVIALSLGAITPTSVAASGTVTGSNLSGTNTGNQTITLTGDVTGSGTGSFAATIANNAVTNAKSAQAAANTLRGNMTGSLANVADNTLAVSQAWLQMGLFYQATISQTGASAPVVAGFTTNVGAPVYAYVSPGVYTVTLATFASNKTRCGVTQAAGSTAGFVQASRTSGTVITINTLSIAGVASDGLLGTASTFWFLVDV